MSLIDEIINEIRNEEYPEEQLRTANGLDEAYLQGYNDAIANAITVIEGFRTEVES